jgi:hypothetical protein
MSQERRLFRDLSLVGNFTDESVKLGNIYRMDDSDFVLAANVMDLDPTIDISAITDAGKPADRIMQSANSVVINTKAKATSPIGDDELEVLFKKADSGFIYMKNAITYTIKYELVKEKIFKIWKDKGWIKTPMKYCFCNQVIEGESGSVLISTEANNRVVLQHTPKTPASSAGTLVDGKFDIQVNTKRTNEIFSQNSFVPVFQALRFRVNGEIEIIGEK